MIPLLLLWAFQTVLTTAAHADSSPDAGVSQMPPAEVLQLRDPFKRPFLPVLGSGPKSELERFPIEQFKMIGVVTGPDKVRAMLYGPNGKTYFVAKSMKIGIRSGVINRITPDGVHVRERVINVLGQVESVENVIPLVPEKKDEKKIAGGG